jgi:cytochrome P450/NADPH-cytochrome P450 reductase
LHIAGDGLFTGNTDDPNRQGAQYSAFPVRSQKAMGGCLPMMTDIASQLMLKWRG